MPCRRRSIRNWPPDAYVSNRPRQPQPTNPPPFHPALPSPPLPSPPLPSPLSECGVKSEIAPLHHVFTGNPGTGKTTVAMKMGELYREMGFINSGHTVQATRADLVGQYIGHTGPKTKEMITRSFGGILFIDEVRPSDRLPARLLFVRPSVRHCFTAAAAACCLPLLTSAPPLLLPPSPSLPRRPTACTRRTRATTGPR